MRHEDYCELAYSDTKSESYQTVNVLDVDQFSQSVYDAYNVAYTKYQVYVAYTKYQAYVAYTQYQDYVT